MCGLHGLPNSHFWLITSLTFNARYENDRILAPYLPLKGSKLYFHRKHYHFLYMSHTSGILFNFRHMWIPDLVVTCFQKIWKKNQKFPPYGLQHIHVQIYKNVSYLALQKTKYLHFTKFHFYEKNSKFIVIICIHSWRQVRYILKNFHITRNCTTYWKNMVTTKKYNMNENNNLWRIYLWYWKMPISMFVMW